MIAHEQLRNVSFADRVHRIQITRHAAYERHLAVDRRVHAVVVAGSEVHDRELAPAVTRGVARVADQLAYVVVLTLDEDPRARIDTTAGRELAVRRTDYGVRADEARSFSERTREERVEARVRPRLRHGLIHVHAVGA